MLPEQHGQTHMECDKDWPQSTVGRQSENGTAGHARCLNAIVSQLLCRAPVDLSVSGSKHSPAHVVRDVAKLAASYGCIQHVRGELISAIVATGAIGGDFVGKTPCLLLETACLLENKAIFVNALRHAVGRRPALADQMRFHARRHHPVGGAPRGTAQDEGEGSLSLTCFTSGDELAASYLHRVGHLSPIPG